MKTKSLLLPFIAMLLTPPATWAQMQGHAPPHLAVGDATDIAVGVVQVSRINGLQVRFIPQTVLKGNLQPGGTYIVDYTNDRTRLSYPNVIPQIAAATEGKPAVMLLGRLQPDGRTLTPSSLEGAVWPRSTQDYAPLQTPKTLEECIAFVKALLADPNLKLKKVNERRVLPDGYIPPAAHLGEAPPDDNKRVLSYHSPSRAVANAMDIAVGSLQVSRENGLEMRFTPQSVLKGGMQPGTAYTVDYPLGRLSYRDYLPQIAAAAEGKPNIILLGRLHSDGKTFEPEGRDSAVWPRSSKWGGLFQTPDTLEGCITFVKALLASPGLKLKIVNGRQMLPDGYALPPSSSGTIKSDKTPPAPPKAP